jgi:hypothetical protein
MTWKMENKYRGKCDRCGKTVKAGEGFLTFVRPHSVDWPHPKGVRGDIGILEHRECHEKYAGTNVHHIHNPAPANG